MKRPVSVWSFTAGALVLFAVLGWQLPRMVGDTPGEQMIIRVVMLVLGLIAAALIFIWLSAKAKAAPAPAAPTDEIGNILQAAKTRLIAAKGKSAGRFNRLPLILVAGPTGAAKTTVITRSGLEAELLSGEVMRGETVLPTSDINVWFAHNNLIVEAGGGVADNEARWRRLMRLVQPSRVGAIFSRGKQASRIAVVCFPCDEFMKPGASEAVALTAQKLRQRLADASQEIGIRLPVYVLFTKLDRVRYFDDYFRSFTRTEAHDVLGATLPIQPVGNPGGFAEREAHRLGEAFYGLFRGLALRRTDLLPREREDAVRAGTYEFPREFRKLSELATQFLIDLCRPSQLGVGPFLRGFYFTGVRAVFKQDAAAAPQLQPRAAATPLDATSVFDPRVLQAQAMAQQQLAGARKVPEWVFLDRVFRDVVLKDAVAQGVTAGGSKVMLWRRVLATAAIAAILVVSTLFTFSFFANRRVMKETRLAVEGARNLALVGAVPDRDALQRLENLRTQAARLNRNARSGSGIGWGMYTGNKVQPDVHEYYFKRFGELLWTPTRGTLKNSLEGLPSQPTATSNYDATYEALKAYLVTTEKWDLAEADFLAPVLVKYWSLNLAVDSAQRSLADSQFVFFANELRFGHPLPQPTDNVVLEKARAFLGEFRGSEQLYGSLLAAARASLQPFRWNGQAPVRNDFEVKAEFTRAGWQKAQDALKNVPRLFAKEPWVLGETATISAAERVQLEQTLRKRYADAYVSAWIDYLKAGGITGLSTVQDAANSLKILAGPASPLLRMIAAASDQTNGLDSVNVTIPFKPAHVVATPNVTTPSPFATKYMSALNEYQTSVDLVSQGRGPAREAGVIAATSNAQKVKTAISELYSSFDPQGRAPDVAIAIRRLLEAPVNITASAIGRVSVDEFNEMGTRFCSQFTRLSGKFPFNRNSTTEASFEEIAEVFAPNTGSLWTFYQENLQSLMNKAGVPVPRTNASFQVNAAFRNHFAYLAQVSEGFFEEGNADPLVEYTLTMNTSAEVPTINVNVDRLARFTRTNPSGQSLTWGRASSQARIDAQVGNSNVTYVTPKQGQWAVFRMFYEARFETRNDGSRQLTWSPPGPPPIRGLLVFEDRIPIFDPTFLSKVGNCVSQIVAR